MAKKEQDQLDQVYAFAKMTTASIESINKSISNQNKAIKTSLELHKETRKTIDLKVAVQVVINFLLLLGVLFWGNL